MPNKSNLRSLDVWNDSLNRRIHCEQKKGKEEWMRKAALTCLYKSGIVREIEMLFIVEDRLPSRSTCQSSGAFLLQLLRNRAGNPSTKISPFDRLQGPIISYTHHFITHPHLYEWRTFSRNWIAVLQGLCCVLHPVNISCSHDIISLFWRIIDPPIPSSHLAPDEKLWLVNCSRTLQKCWKFSAWMFSFLSPINFQSIFNFYGAIWTTNV